MIAVAAIGRAHIIYFLKSIEMCLKLMQLDQACSLKMKIWTSHSPPPLPGSAPPHCFPPKFNHLHTFSIGNPVPHGLPAPRRALPVGQSWDSVLFWYRWYRYSVLENGSFVSVFRKKLMYVKKFKNNFNAF